MKKVFKGIGVFVGVVIVALIAIVLFVPTEEAAPVQVNKEASASTTSEETVPASTEAEDKVYKIGDTVSFKGLEVTILSAEFTEPAEYSETVNGKVLTLTVEAVNNSDDKLMIDNTEFNIYDMDNNGLEQYYGYNDMAIADTINKGKKVTGKLYFDVTDSSSFELIYTPIMTFDGSTDIVFDLEVPAK